MPDHVHILNTAKESRLQSRGLHKEKSLIMIARHLFDRQRNFTGYKFWAKGSFATTVGLQEQIVRNYNQHQETEDKRESQFELFK